MEQADSLLQITAFSAANYRVDVRRDLTGVPGENFSRQQHTAAIQQVLIFTAISYANDLRRVK
jgi:hypothetical protein